jgi:hypothetical protein
MSEGRKAEGVAIQEEIPAFEEFLRNLDGVSPGDDLERIAAEVAGDDLSRLRRGLLVLTELVKRGFTRREAVRVLTHLMPPARKSKAVGVDADSIRPAFAKVLDENLELHRLVEKLAEGMEERKDFRFGEVASVAKSAGLFPYFLKGTSKPGNNLGVFVLDPRERQNFRFLLTGAVGKCFCLSDGRSVVWSAKGKNRGRWYQLAVADESGVA